MAAKLQRRELPLRNSFTVPHVQAFHGARYFMSLLESQTSAVHRRGAELGGGEEALEHAAEFDALERQALSEAVQVFAAMATEAAVNLLGVLTLGEETFLDRLERKPQLEKLRVLLDLLSPAARDQAAELLRVAKTLADARNAFAHPKSRETDLSADVSLRRGDVESAREAMADVLHFFKLLGAYDRTYATFFQLW
jgi:hypothetical protein